MGGILRSSPGAFICVYLHLFALISDPPLFCSPEKLFLPVQVIPKALLRYFSMGETRSGQEPHGDF